MSVPGLRIAHVLPWRNVGGTEIATLRLARAAAVHGHASIAFHLPGAMAVRDLFADAGCATVEFGAVVPSYRSMLRYFATSRELARAFREHRIDVVHCADIRSAYHAGLAGKLARVPVICHVRNRYADLSLRDRSFLWQVDRFVFVSEATRRAFAHRVPDSRAAVLYDGVDVPARAESDCRARARAKIGAHADAPVAGMVARVARQKDYETLVRAAKIVVQALPEAQFIVVGDHQGAPEHREYFREIMKQIRREGMEAHFRFTGYVTNVESILPAFDVFVLSTHWEGFPLVILEAMARGLPVVATAVDGIPEVVESGRTGLLFEEGDADSLASHLVRLLAEPEECARMGEQARRRIEAEFSTHRYEEAVGTLYRSVIGGASQERTA